MWWLRPSNPSLLLIQTSKPLSNKPNLNIWFHPRRCRAISREDLVLCLHWKTFLVSFHQCLSQSDSNEKVTIFEKVVNWVLYLVHKGCQTSLQENKIHLLIYHKWAHHEGPEGSRKAREPIYQEESFDCVQVVLKQSSRSSFYSSINPKSMPSLSSLHQVLTEFKLNYICSKIRDTSISHLMILTNFKI